MIFSFLSKKLNLKTPGREDDTQEVKLYTKADVNAKRSAKGDDGNISSEDTLSEMITRGLGGKNNIDSVDCCATRLRCTVASADLVDDVLLKSTGASGVIHKGNGVQIIYGPNVTVIKSNLEEYLETAPDIIYTNDNEMRSESDDAMQSQEIEGSVAKTVIVIPVRSQVLRRSVYGTG